MKTNSKKLVNPATGEIFNSCREADRKYGYRYGTAWHIASGCANDHGVTLEFITEPDVEHESIVDPDLLEYIYTERTVNNGISVRCLETNQIFNSCREADIQLGLFRGQTNHILRGKCTHPFYHFERVDSLNVVFPTEFDEEEFKVIPEFPTYSISNFGRIMRNSTKKIKKHTKHVDGNSVTYHVMLYKDSKPALKSLKALFDSAWRNISLKRRTSTSSHISKAVTCLTDNKKFHSYIECVDFYNFDYQRFRESLHASSQNQFTYKGKVFEIAR